MGDTSAGRRRATRVLFLDLDGTSRYGRAELGRFVNTAADVVMFPEALERMRAWRNKGGRIVGVSNQGGVALGHVSDEDCHDAMRATMDLSDGLFDFIGWCPHHPAALDPEMGDCYSRKPAPGLLIEGWLTLCDAYPDEFYPPGLALMVGDRPEDEQCAARAGVEFMSAERWRAVPSG